MDLGNYRPVNDNEEPEMGQRNVDETPTRSFLEITRTPARASSIELASLNDSQKKIPLDVHSQELSEPLVGSDSARKARRQKGFLRGLLGVRMRMPRVETPEKVHRPAWFTTVSTGLALAIIVLIVNLTILVWTYSRFPIQNSSAVLFTGSCARASTITAVAELVINVLSTLLLAASNNCAQLLISPSRTEVDRAHENGVWIHVGVVSARNFGWIGRWRILMWAVLFASSVPLHLLYNSVIYSSSYTNDWVATAVTEDFVEGGFWNQTVANDYFTYAENAQYNDNQPQHYLSILSSMQNSTASLISLSNSECQSAYGTSELQSPYLNVLLVTNSTSPDGVIDVLAHYPEWGTDFTSWFDPQSSDLSSNPGCASVWDYSMGSNWSLPICNCTINACTTDRAFVQNCLAQPASKFDDQCTVSISLSLLIAVICCNALKATCLAGTLLASSRHLKGFKPLTVGDAVASFLERPDETTRGCGALGFRSARKILGGQGKVKEKEKGGYLWTVKEKGRRWGYALSSGGGGLVVALIILGWFVLTVSLGVSWTGNIVSSWSHDVNYSTYSAITTSSINPTNLLGNVLLINTPQLAISIFYVLYNSLFTRMLVAYEFSQYGTHRKGLSVSKPQPGTAQRSTYYLQLPYRYIIPMMSSMALIHFFISRGLYLVNIRVYNIAGIEVPYRDHFRHATSGLALLCALIVGTLMLFALLFSICRSLGTGMPIIGTNSAAISAACHSVVGDEDAATKALMYGVVEGLPRDQGLAGDRGDVAHVCFSSFEVTPLEDGRMYY